MKDFLVHCDDLLISLQWVDREGKTPLIVACMNPELYDVAKTLIELGAKVNAYRPGIVSVWLDKSLSDFNN